MNTPALLNQLFPKDVVDLIYWEYAYPLSREDLKKRYRTVLFQLGHFFMMRELRALFNTT